MLKLHGFPISNYFNMAKIALLEKGIEFEEVTTRPSQEDEYLDRSPMGKVPCLETDAGFITEVDAIIGYLENIQPEPALLPSDPFERAKVDELIRYLQLYVELEARRCFPEVFFGGKVSDETKEQVKAALTKGIAAVGRLTRFDPYIAGKEFSAADIVASQSLGLANAVSQRLYDENLLEALPGASDWLALVNGRESLKTIAESQKAARGS